MSRPRVGLVGCGRWGRHILRDLVSLGCDVEVVARGEASRERARQGGASSIVRDLGSLGDVRGVVVATTTVTHADVVQGLLPRGVPVFVEKPLCPEVPAARRLAHEGAGRVFVMDKWRHHPGVEALRDVARSGELGAVRGLRTARVQWGSSHTDVDIVWILLSHDLSIALEVLGGVPPARLAHGDGEGSGWMRRIVAVFGREPWVVAEVAGDSPRFHRQATLVCEGGVAVLEDGSGDHVSICRERGFHREPAVERRPISGELPLRRELRAFLEHVAGGPPPKSSVEDGLAVVEAIARARSLAGFPETALRPGAEAGEPPRP